MRVPLHNNTTLAVCAIAGILFLAFPLWPSLIITFEAGLMTGLFLHSSHSRYKSSDTSVSDTTDVIATDGGFKSEEQQKN